MVRIVDNITPTMLSSMLSSVSLNECDWVAASNDDKLAEPSDRMNYSLKYSEMLTLLYLT